MLTNSVWLVRHGATAWSESGRHTGRTDIPLTAAGETAARSLPARLAEVDFTTVLSSPLQRARRTCELAGFTEYVVDDDLAEWDYGAYEGLTTPQIRERRPDWFLWRDGCPDGESAGEVGARADRVIARLQSGELPAVLFAHGHLLRVLAARWLGQPAAGGRLYALSTAAICVLGYEREQRVLWRWNESSVTK